MKLLNCTEKNFFMLMLICMSIASACKRLPEEDLKLANNANKKMLANNTSSGTLPWLHVEGNQIKDEAGNVVTLRGFSLLPNESNDECGTCNTKPISELLALQADTSQGWFSRVVRIGVHQAYSDPVAAFANHIDPFVQQAISLGQYAIVDLHLVSNYGTGGIPQSKVLDFWSYVAPRYANNPQVIFEVYNEPINPDNWTTWKDFIQPVIDTIRAVAPNNLILMGGPQWSTRVNEAAANPFDDHNMAYVYHIYPNQPASTSSLDSKFGNAANSIPIVITEFGWNADPNYSDGITYGTSGGWGKQFRTYMDNHPHIGWANYIFDNYWKPQIFDWNWNLMGGENQGKFIRDWLFEMQNHNQAGGFNPGPQTAYAAQAIPGKIQAENFDNGGQDVSFHETTYENQGGVYRNTPVDIGTTTDDGGSHTIGYINPGEWLEYTISNVNSGTYNINLRVACGDATPGRSITVKLDGVSLGTVTPTNTGGWDTYQNFTLENVTINGGTNKILRLEFGGIGYNVNWIEFTSGSAAPNEAESLSKWSNGASYTKINDASASGGAWIRLAADGVGDFITYTINHTGGQTNYNVYLRYQAGPNRGQCQLYEGGVAKGGVFDQYSANLEYKESLVASNVTLWDGARNFKFEVTGKNANSSGYELSQDYIRLVAMQ